MITKGSKAIDFTLPDQFGKLHSLRDYAGQWVLLYFYPKDDTPGCTKEACTIRDAWKDFTAKHAVVLGISADSQQRHEKFARKYKLPFTILADQAKQVIISYGAWGKKKFMGREYMGIRRISYLIDPKGNIAQAYERVKPSEHAGEVLADIP